MEAEEMGADDKPWRPESTEVVGPPRLLAGKYQLGKLIGEGGMGSVYAALHTGLNAQVAIKLLAESFVTDSDSLTRFRREAHAMGAIRHDNVVFVMDTGADEDGVPFIVMELLEGESLSAILRRERNISSARACSIVIQILAGLGAAHQHGIIHRDLKPGNVFMAYQADGSLRAKILDFGISKLTGTSAVLDVTADGVTIGTPSYMAPEQLRGETELDARVDVYAAAVTLYRMLTGRLPYRGKTSEQLAANILAGNAILPRTLRPEIAPQIETVVLKAMDVDRDRRFSNAVSFQRALRTAAGSIWSEGLGSLSALANRLKPATTSAIQQTSHVDNDPPSDSIAATDTNRTDTNRTDTNRTDTNRTDTNSAHTVVASPAAKRANSDDSDAPLATTSIAPPASEQTISPPVTQPQPSRRRVLGSFAAMIGAAGGGALIYEFYRSKSASTTHSPSSGPPLRFGITRYLPSEQLSARYRGLVDYLERELDRPTQLILTEDADELQSMLAGAAIDLAALSPYPYVQAVRARLPITILATPVTHSGRKGYYGSILVRSDSSIRNISELTGKPFCFVKSGSTSGWLIPRREFRQVGVNPDTDFSAIHYGQNHLGTLKLLASQTCAGASVFTNIWHEAAEHRLDPDAFRSVADYFMPNDAYVVSTAVSDQQRMAIQKALLKLKSDSELAHQVLANHPDTGGFIPPNDADFDGIRTAVDLENAAKNHLKNPIKMPVKNPIKSDANSR